MKRPEVKSARGVFLEALGLRDLGAEENPIRVRIVEFGRFWQGSQPVRARGTAPCALRQAGWILNEDMFSSLENIDEKIASKK